MKKCFYFILLLISTFSLAQVPQGFSYQAVVRDATGNLLANQTVGMRVRIIEDTEFGASIFIETHTPTTNDNGLITVVVGNGVNVSGDFSMIDWTSTAYYISTEIDPAGGTAYSINGTSQLLSVPYALVSETAVNVDNVDLNLNGLSDVSASSPSNNEILLWNGSSWVSGSIGLFNLEDVSGLYTDGNILRYNAASSRWVPSTDQVGAATPWSVVVDEDDIYYNDGNVGIGTSSPSERLHVNDDVRFGNNIYFGNTERFYDGGSNTIATDDFMHFDSNGSFSNPHVRISEPGSGGVARLYFSNDDPDDWRMVARPEPAASPEDALFGINYASSDIFTLLGDGRVGIGTNSPASDLHIIQRASSPGIRFSRSGTSNVWSINHGFSNRFYFSFNSGETAYITSGGSFITPSDNSLKENIQPLPYVLDDIMNLRPVSYHLKNDVSQQVPIGFIAQEVQEVFPSIVHTSNEEGLLALNYADFGVYAIKAIQEQQAQIEKLNERLDDQSKELAELRKMIEDLKN